MHVFAVIALMLAFVALIAWSSRDEWRLSWLLLRNPSILAVTSDAIAKNEAYLVGEMRRLLRREGLDEDDVWAAWITIRDAFIEDDVLPALEPRLIHLVADPQNAIRWKVNAHIDGQIIMRCRDEPAVGATDLPGSSS